jgi:DnaJ-class molecular chaperone
MIIKALCQKCLGLGVESDPYCLVCDAVGYLPDEQYAEETPVFCECGHCCPECDGDGSIYFDAVKIDPPSATLDS